MRVHLAYGKEGLSFKLPDDLHIDVVEPKYDQGLADQTAAVVEALGCPIGSRPLAERVGEGGKAVMPGLAQLETIQCNHGAANIDNDQERWGITTGNPIWRDVHEAVDMVENTFLLNVSMNRDKEITGVFAGSLREAHAAGVEQVCEQAMVAVPNRYDLVITGNSGYPLDLNMYQSVKGMSAAFQIVKEGADILLAADCWDGIPAHGSYGSLLASAERPQELLEQIRHATEPVQDMWQAQIHAKICDRVRVHFYSENLATEDIERAFMIPAEDMEHEVERILEDHLRRGERREDFRICVLPEGPLTIPYYS